MDLVSLGCPEPYLHLAVSEDVAGLGLETGLCVPEGILEVVICSYHNADDEISPWIF